jgi:hypothetical protein
MIISLSREHKRIDGWRTPDKTGVGIYLVGPLYREVCERLPYPLGLCNSCSGDIGPHGNWGFINPVHVLTNPPNCVGYDVAGYHDHDHCLMCSPAQVLENEEVKRAMLIWVGGRAYTDPLVFIGEAFHLGVGRRVSNLPEWFQLGRTWAFLAHMRAVMTEESIPKEKLKSRAKKTTVKVYRKGIMACFKPKGVDLVVKDIQEVPERALDLVRQFGGSVEDKADGFRILQIERAEGEQEDLLTNRKEEEG